VARHVLTQPIGHRHVTSDVALAVNHVADRIIEMPLTGPRIAIDGPDGAGKTHFADQLAAVLQNRHVPIVRISIDNFHNLRAVRYRQGRQSPIGFWEDSYNYSRFHADVLAPFAPGGSRRFRRASYSHASDEIRHPTVETADPAAVLVVDGIFLQRLELGAHWDTPRRGCRRVGRRAQRSGIVPIRRVAAGAVPGRVSRSLVGGSS